MGCHLVTIIAGIWRTYLALLFFPEFHPLVASIHLRPHRAGTSASSRPKVELLVFADANWLEEEEKNARQMASVRCFANHFGYSFRTFGVKNLTATNEAWALAASSQTRKGCLDRANNPYFLRHCLLAAYLESKVRTRASKVHLLQQDTPGADVDHEDKVETDEHVVDPTIYIALDSDIGARSFDLDLAPWLSVMTGTGSLSALPPNATKANSTFTEQERSATATTSRSAFVPHGSYSSSAAGADLMFFERWWGLEHHNDVMAGSYMVRNNPRTRRFLRQWATLEHRRPEKHTPFLKGDQYVGGFDSADNGALHLALLAALGIPASPCEEDFHNLPGSSGLDIFVAHARVLSCCMGAALFMLCVACMCTTPTTLLARVLLATARSKDTCAPTGQVIYVE